MRIVPARVYELNNVALLREVHIESYLSSAEKYCVLRAEIETLEKAALAYREFVREAVTRCVLEFKALRKDQVLVMATEAGIPEDDLAALVAYFGQQVRGLHEGNVIRYRLGPADLEGLVQE